ncbi:MAG: GNAT family N-acetyltransferase [Armatimonadota bacterium]|nr:MAG: GNAT family N-acetyltransferase [Armatimonadota bacterium]
MAVKAKRVKSKQDLARAVDLAARVFSNYFVGVQQWTDVLRIDPGYAPGQTFVVERDGQFVSHCRVTMRHIRLGSQVGLLGGIGDVATHAGYQNRGYGSACLEEAIRFMEEAGCCLSSLGTGRFSFYGRLGWEVAVPGYRVQLRTDRPPPEALDGYARRRFEPDRDLPAVMGLFEAYTAGRLFSAVRSEDYWRRQMEFTAKPPFDGPWGFGKEDVERFTVITDSSRAVAAYARSRRGDERLELVEAVARDRAAARALLAHLAEQYRHRREIVLDEPPDSLIAVVALTDCGGQCTVAHSGTMVRIIDLRRLFDLLAPEFGVRIRASELAETAGALRLETEIGSVTLEWNRGEVAVSKARKGWRLEIPHRRLTQIVTGYRSPASVLEESGRLGALEPDQARALDVLFPRRYSHMHALDRF